MAARTATGGGNHIVIGGRPCWTVLFCAVPDLLRSMVAFWQNHPSLSYLFSGMYVGPTSQYPRVDEARMDACMNSRLPFAISLQTIVHHSLSMDCSAIYLSTLRETRIAQNSASTSFIRRRASGCNLDCSNCEHSKWRLMCK